MWRAIVVLALAANNCGPHNAEAIVAKGKGIGRSFGGGKPPDPFALTNTYSSLLEATEWVASVDNNNSNYTTLSISMWYKSDSALTGNRMMLSKITTREYEVKVDASDITAVRWIPGNSTANYCNSTAGVLSSTWTHLLFVWNGSGTGNAGRCFIYANGVNVTNTYGGTIPASITQTAATVQINAVNTGSTNSHGYYDEIAIWYSDQTSNLTNIYHGGEPGNLASFNPTNWWRMGDDALDDLTGTTGTIRDQSGNGYHGTPQNTEAGDKVADVP